MKIWLVRGVVAAVVAFFVGTLATLQQVYLPNLRGLAWDVVFAIIFGEKNRLDADDWSIFATSTVVWVIPEVLFSLALYVIGERIAAKVFQFDRPRRGCCVACGYNLRGVSGKCPECGQPTGQASPDQQSPIILRD